MADAADGGKHRRMQVGNHETVHKRVRGNFQTCFDAGIHGVHVAANNHHVLSGADRAVDDHTDVGRLQHRICNLKPLGDARRFDDSNCAAVVHSMTFPISKK